MERRGGRRGRGSVCCSCGLSCKATNEAPSVGQSRRSIRALLENVRTAGACARAVVRARTRGQERRGEQRVGSLQAAHWSFAPVRMAAGWPRRETEGGRINTGQTLNSCFAFLRSEAVACVEEGARGQVRRWTSFFFVLSVHGSDWKLTFAPVRAALDGRVHPRKLASAGQLDWSRAKWNEVRLARRVLTVPAYRTARTVRTSRFLFFYSPVMSAHNASVELWMIDRPNNRVRV